MSNNQNFDFIHSFSFTLYNTVKKSIDKNRSVNEIKLFIENLIYLYQICCDIELKVRIIGQKEDVLILFIENEHSIIKNLWEVYIIGNEFRIYNAGRLVFYD